MPLSQEISSDSLTCIKKQVFNMIGEDCQDDTFEEVFQKLERSLSEEDVLKILSQLIGKKRTKQIGPKIVLIMGKNIKANPIQIRCNEFREKGLQHVEIQRLIRKIFQTGQKYAQTSLLKFFGQQYISIYQKYQKNLIEKVKEPLKNSKYLSTNKGLKFFHYIEPNLTNIERNNAKVLMVLGQTGCGKSTFLNSLINYLCQVQLNDPFRYQIIVENTSDQTMSITKEIKTYYVKNERNGRVYKLIDTPGFGDTDGLKSDSNLIKMIEKKFKEEIQTIDCVMFVIKSSNVRLNHYQKYIFQSVLDLFGKDVAENFCFILTFSDAGDPPVLPSLQNEKQGFGKYWNQVPIPKYIQVNNGAFFQSIDLEDRIKSKYWQIGMESMYRLLNRVDKCKPASLILTKELIKKKETLSNRIRATRQKIQTFGKSTTQKALSGKLKEYDRYLKETNDAYEQMFQLNQELQKIAMTNKKSESFIEYIEIQIKNQKQFRTRGWEDRVKQLQLMLEQAKINESYVKGNKNYQNRFF